MKIRQGFVSNSSTTSFTIYGAYITPDDAKAVVGEVKGNARWTLESKLDKGFSCEGRYDDDSDGFWVGRSWDSVRDDETGAQFKKSVEDAIEKLFGKKLPCETHEDAWYDG